MVFGYLHENVFPPALTMISSLSKSLLELEKATIVLVTPSTM